VVELPATTLPFQPELALFPGSGQNQLQRTRNPVKKTAIALDLADPVLRNRLHTETHGAHSGKYSDTRTPDPHPRLFFEQLASLGVFLFTMRPSVKHFEEFLWVPFKFTPLNFLCFMSIQQFGFEHLV
jgi:hypothetical protein